MFKQINAFKFISAVVTILGLSIMGYLLLVRYQSNENRLISEFRNRLISEDFKVMYADSSDFMKLNVSEDEFARRMIIVTEALREYDPNFDFRRNTELENSIKQVRKSSDPDNQDDDSNHSFVLLETGMPEKRALIQVSWTLSGIKPRLHDLSIGDSKISVTNQINTLAGEPFLAGE